MSSDAVDAARYRWIKAQRNLELQTCKVRGIPWTDTETGERYYPTHYLNTNGTGFGGLRSLDELVDQAMDLYPLADNEILDPYIPDSTLDGIYLSIDCRSSCSWREYGRTLLRMFGSLYR